MAASLSPALSSPCPTLTVVQSFRETYPRPPPAVMHAGRIPTALQARAGARYAGVGPEPGWVNPARTRRGRSCNRDAVAVRHRLPMVCAAAAGTLIVYPGMPKLDKISFRERSHPSEYPVLTGLRQSESVALSSLRLLELDPSPAPTPPTLQTMYSIHLREPANLCS